MTATREPSRLLALARREGVLIDLPGGCAVGGVYDEPGLGRPVWLLEYVTPEVLGATDLGTRLGRAQRGRGVDRIPALIRVAPDEHPAGSRHFSHYVRLEPLAVPASRDGTDGVEVRAATPKDDQLLSRWLRCALERGYLAHPDRAAPLDRQIVPAILSDRNRRSWIAVHGGAAVGHLTVLLDCHDPVTGEEPIELLDVLAEGGARREAEEALVRVAREFAARSQRPLLGHVVCEPLHGADEPRCKAILASLERRGWRRSHDYVLMETT